MSDIAFEDIPVQLYRAQDHELYTFVEGDDIIQTIAFTFPDGSASPLIALTPTQYSNLITDMQKRQHAALEDQHHQD